ncbi:YdcF family protein [Luteibacter sp. Sphag1AF]|uniref:YdcF family protein n=1 Tax=Luteibacter sp. Sphag1AF TaxID=2587031 RepID=UPI00160CCA6F|nr:YdcF family protein [Luteibacter sp. Sphag1AF]
MTLALILLLIGLACLWAHRRRTAVTFFILSLGWVFAVGCGPVADGLLTDLQRGFPQEITQWGQHNVIVLLGAGTQRGDQGTVEPGLMANARILRAAELYHACKATGAVCRLEVSGGDAAGLKQSEAAVYSRTLIALGVTDTDLLAESRSMNTFQNAEFTKPLLAALQADKVVLVSSATHLRRATLYFAHFAINVEPVRADYLGIRYDWLPQPFNMAMADVALHEYVGIARYRFYNVMGWNPPATPRAAS